MPLPQQDLQIYPLSPPSSGENVRDTYFQMLETDALVLYNIIPEANGLRVKEGVSEFQAVATGQTSYTIHELYEADGTFSVIRAAANKLYDVTNSDLDVTGAAVITNNVWQVTQFSNRLFLVNGSDAPLHWTGNGTDVVATSWSGSGLTTSNLISVSHYKRRLFFVEKNTLNVWWAESLDNVSGTLKKTTFETIAKLGGSLVYSGPFSVTLNENEQYMAFVTNAGEVLVYTGDWPEALNWRIIGQYEIAPTLGKRPCYAIDGDLHIITKTGLVSLVGLMSGEKKLVSDDISNLWLTLVERYEGDWQGVYYPDRQYILINLPDTQTGFSQLGYNLVSQGWFRFAYWNTKAICYSRGDQSLLFHYTLADAVFRGDYRSEPGLDPPGTLEFFFHQAFSPLGAQNRILQKDLVQVELFIELSTNSDNPPAILPHQQNLTVQISSDYKAADYASHEFPVSFTDSTTYFEALVDITGQGKTFSLGLFGNLTEPCQLKYFGANIYWVDGGVE